MSWERIDAGSESAHPDAGRVQPLAPGWWQASDGLFYRPELHPSRAVTPPPQYSPPPQYAPPQFPPPQYAPPQAQSAPSGYAPAQYGPPRHVPPFTAAPNFTVRPNNNRLYVLLGILGIVCLVAVIVGVTSSSPSLSSSSPPTSLSADDIARAIDDVARSGDDASVTNDSPLDATMGTVVFTDSFDDPASGWAVDVLPSGHAVSYGPGLYSLKGQIQSFAPQDAPRRELMVSATGSTIGPRSADHAFGVKCTNKQPTIGTAFAFAVADDGRWVLSRVKGNGQDAAASFRESGTVPGWTPPADAAVSATPLHISLVCATLADGTRTRLVGFVGDAKVVDMVDIDDVDERADAAGWVGALVAYRPDPDLVMAEFTDFELRDLG